MTKPRRFGVGFGAPLKKIATLIAIPAVTLLVTNCTGDFTVTYLHTLEGDNYASQKDVSPNLPQELSEGNPDLIPELAN